MPIEQVREFSEDFAIMLEWFDAVGYSADIQGNQAGDGIGHAQNMRSGSVERE